MKSVLILGAVSDIAGALAHKYASQGYQLFLAARRADRLAEMVVDLEIRYNINVSAVEFDALAYDSHAAFYRSLPVRPDVVICIFGYLGDQQQAQADFAEAKKIIDSNYTGAVSILEIVAADFEQCQAGTIIGIGSVAGDRGRQSNYIYGSAKAALATYLSGLRNRLAKANVQVMTVKPGFVRTKMTAGIPLPTPVTAKPDQVARDVYQAYQKNSSREIYTLWMWRYIMFIIRNIPEPIFKRLKL